MSKQYHAMEVGAVVEALGSGVDGLGEEAAARRLEADGTNELPLRGRRSVWRVALAQFANPLMVVIGGAVAVSMVIGHMTDAIFILVIIVLNAIVGFIQEVKAEKALETLSRSLRFRARVLRSGREMLVDSAEVVVGDVLILQPGDRVAADARVVSSDYLQVAEAALSGESHPIDKVVEAQPAEAGMTDRRNMVYASTVVESGTAQVVVVATASETQIGQIAQMIGEADERQSPLQTILRKFTYWMTGGLLVVIALFSAIGLARGGAATDVLMTAVALVVSAIPEGLLPAVTVVLVVGMRRLAAGKALVRKLSAVETMGAISVICMDKTGTLTTGQMRTRNVFAGVHELTGDGAGYEMVSSAVGVSDKSAQIAKLHTRALAIGMLVNDATVNNPDAPDEKWNIDGRPTDRALLLAGLQSGLRRDVLMRKMLQMDVQLFSSANKFATRTMAPINQSTKAVKYILGAPEVVMDMCSQVANEDESEKLTDNLRKNIDAHIVALASQGYRVLACAEGDTLIGIITLADPVRTEVAQSIASATAAGVRPIVITGDYLGTAMAVLADVGLEVRSGQSMVGADIDKLDDVALAEAVRQTILFARVLPAHKIRIVRALMRSGETVAMVGDGVNDAPALKAADVGIVVGSGTDLAKTVADIVLLDDSFATIVRAIRQGRQVFANVRRIILFLLADDFSELMLFFVALMLGAPVPLLSAQILWINVIEDGLPSMALTATNTASASIMRTPPQSLRASLMSGAMRHMMVGVFIVSSVAAIGVYLVLLWFDMPIEEIRTILFVLMSIDSLLFAYIVLTLDVPLFSRAALANKWLNWAVACSVLFLLIGVYFPPAQNLLATIPLNPLDWTIIIAIAIIETLLLEWIKRREW